MVTNKTLLTVLEAFFLKKYKNPKLVSALMQRCIDRINELEKQGFSVHLEILDMKTPSREVRTFKVPGTNKERQR